MAVKSLTALARPTPSDATATTVKIGDRQQARAVAQMVDRHCYLHYDEAARRLTHATFGLCQTVYSAMIDNILRDVRQISRGLLKTPVFAYRSF